MHAQVEDPETALPVGIVGAVVISAALYVALSAVICAMVPYGDIQVPQLTICMCLIVRCICCCALSALARSEAWLYASEILCLSLCTS